jgi:hypothetical protein
MMGRTLPTVLALTVGTVLAIPTSAAGQTPAQDSVAGSGTSGGFFFAIDARSGPSGENPAGSATIGLLAAPEVRVAGPVICLTVNGTRAVIGIQNTAGFPTEFITGAFIEVTDGTPDSLGLMPLDQFPLPTVCPASVASEFEPVSGDVVVTDARPFPISRDECKNGGWRNFGDTFKNQGQCVAFVQRGPEP